MNGPNGSFEFGFSTIFKLKTSKQDRDFRNLRKQGLKSEVDFFSFGFNPLGGDPFDGSLC